MFEFGKEQADKYGDLIVAALAYKRVSKRKDLAEEPGGLIYEANRIGIDKWDLLEALEGMCRDGRAVEIDDSTYVVVRGHSHDHKDDAQNGYHIWYKDDATGEIKCSNCEREIQHNSWGKPQFSSFCPYCGEKMKYIRAMVC